MSEAYRRAGVDLDAASEAVGLIRELARGARVLNLFAYTGGFTVAAVAGGARSSVTVDVSRGALTWAAVTLAGVEVGASGEGASYRQYVRRRSALRNENSQRTPSSALASSISLTSSPVRSSTTWSLPRLGLCLAAFRRAFSRKP